MIEANIDNPIYVERFVAFKYDRGRGQWNAFIFDNPQEVNCLLYWRVRIRVPDEILKKETEVIVDEPKG